MIIEDAMELHSENKRFILQIDNYQFIDANNEDDRNWLMVWVYISEPTGNWSFHQPFLTINDLPRWAEWFENITNNIHIDMLFDSDYIVSINFCGIVGELYHIKVNFRREGLPPYFNRFSSSAIEANIYSVDLYISSDQLHAASKSLTEDMRRFPPR